MSNPGQIGSIIGFAIGAAIAIVATWGAATPAVIAAVGAGAGLGAAAGGLAGNLYQTATTPDSVREQQSLADLKIQTSTQGKIIPQIIGTNGQIAGNIIYATDKIEHQHRKVEDAQGGKGGGPQQITIMRTYTFGVFVIVIADTRLTGPLSILKVFRDLRLFADMTGETRGGGIDIFTIEDAGSGYALGDTGTIAGGGNDALYFVSAVNAGGVVSITISDAGSDYLAGDADNPQIYNLSNGGGQPGSGVGASINLTRVFPGGGISTFDTTATGTGYAVNDTGALFGGGNGDGRYLVTAVDMSGGVTSVTLTSGGSGYTIGVALPLVPFGDHPGAGDGLAEITPTAIAPGGLPDNWTYYTGTADQLPDPTIESYLGAGNVPGYRYCSYAAIRDEDLGASGTTHNYTFLMSQQSSNKLIDIVPLLCAPCGIAGDNLDITDLPPPADQDYSQDTVDTILVSRQQIRAVIEQLAGAYRFYVYESGRTLKFRQIGSGGLVFDIPEDDTDVGEEKSQGQGLSAQRVDDITMATELDFTYIDAGQNYQNNTQRATVAIGASDFNAPQTVTTTLVLKPQTAKQDANELLFSSYIQRENYITQLGRRYATLEPGDRGIVTARGLAYSVMIQEISYGKPGILEISRAVTDAGFMRAAIGGAAGIENQPRQIPDVLEDSVAYLLNLPAMDSSDQALRYNAGYGGGTPWPGGVLLRSTDSGASFDQVDAATLQAITGIVATAMASADWHVIDLVTTFEVIMDYGDLTSVSDTALYNGANLFAVGSEIVGAGLCILTATKTYTLSRLIRGRQGTEWAVGTHVDDERLMLLDAGVRKVAMILSDRNVERPYKIVTIGQDVSLVDSFDFTPTAENVVPWTCANERGTLSAGDWTLEGHYRSPFTGAWLPNNGVMGYDSLFNGFKFTVYMDGTFTTVARMITVTGGTDANALITCTYDASMQTADFGGAQTTLYWTMQIIGAYGDGRANQVTSV